MPYLLAIAAFVGLFAVYVSRRPDAFRVVRTRSIGAPPERLYALVNDFRAWVVWSPWEKLDAALQRTYEGASDGVGARYRWAGKKAGAGTMHITASTPGERIEIDLNFTKPIPANNKVVFRFEPDGAKTRVTWSMEGRNAFVSKAFGVFVDMDDMIGRDFEKGLEAIESAAHAA